MTDRRIRVVERWGLVAGVTGVAGNVLLIALWTLALLPWESVAQYVVGGAGLLVGVPVFLAFPIWLILLSNRLQTHLTEGNNVCVTIGDPLAFDVAESVIDGRAR